jgi:hypothetical protein
MQIHDLNTKALTDPAYVAFDDGTDTYKTDFKAEIDNAAADAVADADLTDNTVAFTSGDAASPTAWTAVSVLTSGLTIKVLFNRISTMIKNVRWLYSKLGTTDISSIGGGTVTGAISSLNSNSVELLNKNWLNMQCILSGNGIKYIRCSTTPNAAMTANTEYNVGTLPESFRPMYLISHIMLFNGNSYGILKITTGGAVTFTPSVNVSTSTGININFAYI